ncbi:UNVERIFIED_CONTAM: hypothetical protein Sradi_1345100 [Sesamum radiatum]|uniref:Retrotransposon Copia-like N-terminal domain-containing protein n=1 Tax=Sesamum radiatum TaxID=300843 RepID=A0AAW2UPZ0_SESRA
MASSSTTVPDTSVGSGNDTGNSRVSMLDHPGMVMISAPLNGNNWLSWSRSMRIALEGLHKLGFIDGTCAKPPDGSADLRQWRITDSMREIGVMTQENLSVTAYYTNMKQLWDKLVCLMLSAMCTSGKCTCGSNKAKVEQIEAIQLIQFLTDLNESYDNIRNQILVLDPLPHINKAYTMVLRVESQRQVNLGFSESGDTSASLRRGFDYRGGSGPKNNMRKMGQVDKRNMICESCNKSGYRKDTCFKLYGVPDWYKDLTDQKRKTGSGELAYAVTEGISSNLVDVSTVGGNLVVDLMKALKLIQAKLPQDPVHVHFAQGDEMTGPEE